MKGQQRLQQMTYFVITFLILCGKLVSTKDEERHHKILFYGPRREKTCFRRFANNTGVDQPAHLPSLISAFVICYLESILCKLATGEISIF